MKKLLVTGVMAVILMWGLTSTASAGNSTGHYGYNDSYSTYNNSSDNNSSHNDLGGSSYDQNYDVSGYDQGGSQKVPEPATLVLMGSGFVGLWAARKFRGRG